MDKDKLKYIIINKLYTPLKNFARTKFKKIQPHNTQFKDLKSISKGGYYHNIKIFNSSTWILFGRRHNSVSSDENFYEIQWGFIEEWLKKNIYNFKNKKLLNKTFLEIGPAEGFHTLKMFESGAKFGWLITPQTILSKRLQLILKIIKIKNFLIISGNFPLVEHADKALEKNFKKCDLILCLGVIYHADDAIKFLKEITKYEVPVILEYAYSYPNKNKKFSPEENNNGANGYMNEEFIYEFCQKNSFKIEDFPEYSSYCLKSLLKNKNKFTRKMIAITKKDND